MNDDTGATATTDEAVAPSAQCPVLGDSHIADGFDGEPALWPEQLNLRPLGEELAVDRSDGRRLRLRD